MIRLITRGDDAGSSATANRAIRDACVDGILLNVSVMVCCDSIEDAADQLRSLDHVCFGFHATLNAEWGKVRWGSTARPSDVPTLVRPDGTFFPRVGELEANGPLLDQAMAELQAQFDRGKQLGFDFRYADQHMGFGRAVPGFEETFDRWCTAEGILNFRHYHKRLPWVKDYVGGPAEQLIASLDAADPGQWAIVGHPGYETEELQLIGNERVDGVEEAKARDGQRRWFMDPKVIAYFDTHDIEAIRYDEAEEI
jgi:predicted glycoside hydrolase/deacetylase ChbG (UPF0249 family)